MLTNLLIAAFVLVSIIMPAAAAFPVEPCEQAWNHKQPVDYSYNYSQDRDYNAYLDRMKDAGLNRKDCYKAWTVLIYLAATKDLLPDLVLNMIELETGNSADGFRAGVSTIRGSSLKTDYVTLLDSDTSDEITLRHMFQTPDGSGKKLDSSNISSLEPSDIRSPVALRFQKNGDAKPSKNQKQQLEDFIKWGMTEYPSNHVMVIIGGHGQGWTAIQNNSSPNQFGGLAIQQSSNYLSIPDLKNVLDNIREWSDQELQKREPIDLLHFDACLMQSAEVAGHLTRCAKFISGSSGIDPYEGCPYGTLSCQMNADKSNYDGATLALPHEEGEAQNLAWMLPKLYKEAFAINGSHRALDDKACKYLTQCSVATERLERLLPALDNLGSAILKFIEEPRPKNDEGDRFGDVESAMKEGPFYPGGTQDLGEFLRKMDHLANEEIAPTPATIDLQLKLKHARQALMDSVINTALGEKYKIPSNPWNESGPMGLSIFMPEYDSDFKNRFEDYSKSALYQKQGWKAFITKIYGS